MLMSSQQKQQRKGIEPRQLISNVEANDVLLGRGNHVHNPGNAKFRTLVLSRSIEYWSCNNNVTKDAIAHQIIDQISSLGGRFLRKVKNTSKSQKRIDSADPETSGDTIDESTPLISESWEIADMETVLVKVKQTFRDFTASAKKRTAVTSQPVSYQLDLPLYSLLRQRSNTLHESNNMSNMLEQANTGDASVLDLRRRDETLSSSGVMHNSGMDHIVPSTGRPDYRDPLHQAARALQVGNVQAEFNQTNVMTGLEELLLRQRAVESWQEQLRQQQVVSDLRMNVHHNRHQDDRIPLLSQNTMLQDQLFLRQLLIQQTPYRSQIDLATLASDISREREAMVFPPNETMMLRSNVPPNPDQFLQTLEEFSRLQRQETQLLLGNLDLRNVTLAHAATSPQFMNTNVLRQLSSAPVYETTFPHTNPNDINYSNAAVDDLLIRQNLLSNVLQPSHIPSKNTDDSDEDDDKKPPSKNK